MAADIQLPGNSETIDLQQQVARAAQNMGADKLKDAAKGALENATKGGIPGSDTTKGATDALKGLFGK